MIACVSTYCSWRSYGSVFQSIGLKKALLSFDCESVLARIGKDVPEKLFSPRTIKKFISLPFDAVNYGNRRKAYEKTVEFIRLNLDIEEYTDYQSLKENPPFADVYITGSDQVWNPSKLSPQFFLQFVEDVKKISYAASMGNTKITDDKASIIKKYLKDFYSISVRENECRDLLADLTELPISVNTDPVLFLSADEWRKYEVAYNVKKPYILLYTIYWNPEMKEKLRRLKQRTGLPVYSIKTGMTRAYSDRSFYDVGPGEFLWLFDNAEYVVTTSFHGAVFSTVFNKKFATCVNPSSPSRIENLHRVLDIPRVDIDDLDKTDLFDYSRICAALNKEKMRGLNYLKEVLK